MHDETLRAQDEKLIFVFENDKRQAKADKTEDDRINIDQENFTTAEEISDDSDGVAPGRPMIIHTGKPGRPKKQYCKKQEKSKLNAAIDENIPESFEEAVLSPKELFWERAMEEEFSALLKNNIYGI